MASIFPANVLTFKAGGAIAKGKVVKIGADREHVAVSSAATDKSFGICQNVVAAAEDKVEVALAGGGAKGLAGGTIAAGDLLTSDANGALVATVTANDRVVGVALEAAVAGDIFSMMVQISNV